MSTLTNQTNVVHQNFSEDMVGESAFIQKSHNRLQKKPKQFICSDNKRQTQKLIKQIEVIYEENNLAQETNHLKYRLR